MSQRRPEPRDAEGCRCRVRNLQATVKMSATSLLPKAVSALLSRALWPRPRQAVVGSLRQVRHRRLEPGLEDEFEQVLPLEAEVPGSGLFKDVGIAADTSPPALLITR